MMASVTEKRKESPTARGYYAGNSNNSGLRIAATSKNCIFSNEEEVLVLSLWEHNSKQLLMLIQPSSIMYQVVTQYTQGIYDQVHLQSTQANGIFLTTEEALHLVGTVWVHWPFEFHIFTQYFSPPLIHNFLQLNAV